MRTLIFSASLALSVIACTEGSTPKAQPAPKAAPAPVIKAPAGALALGAAMPSRDVSMKNVDGKAVTLASVAGEKGTLVVFTCNHCPYAKAWEGRVAAVGNAFMKKGVGVIAINPNDPSKYAEDGFEEMVARSEKLGLEFPYVVDDTSGVARAYGATKTPEAYLFDAEGKLVYHGAVDDSANDPAAVEAHFLEDALTALVDGKEITRKATKAVGCSIKFRPEA